jgi:hypothetical protein
MPFNSTVTVQLADGTYAQNATLDRSIGGVVVVNGNATTPTNVVLNGIITAQSGANITIQNMSIQGIYSKWGSWMTIGGGITFPAFSGGDHIQCGNCGNVYVTNSYTISGSANRHVSVGDSCNVDYLNNLTVTLTGTPAFSTFASLYGLSFVRFHSWGTRVSWSGAATGTRYGVQAGAVLDTNGGGANYLPGNVAGSANTGGQYY